MVDERCRKKIDSAIEAIRNARSEAAGVGIISGFSAIISAVNRGEDAHAWESELSSTLIKAVKKLREAEFELNTAIEIIEDNGGLENESRNRKGSKREKP